MTRLLLGVVLLGLLLSTPAWAQEEGPIEDLEHQMQVRKMKMEMESYERQMEHERQMAEMELAQLRAKVEGTDDGREGGALALLLIGCAVVRVLVAVWIYQDIRLRNAGSGLWIVLGLLGGLLAALVYAVTRLHDADNGKKRTTARA